MNPQLLKSQYDLKPICDISALSLSLSMPEQLLISVSTKADSLYRKAKPITKPDGSIRQPYDAEPPLKLIQRRIKDRILKRVEFPEYLTGSLSGRSYRTNAALHSGAKIIICEDVENFFPATSNERVLDIWLNFFRFSVDVANLLTRLTTKGGGLPQGASTSSYLANLAFWNSEPRLQLKLARLGIVYSRYVDDIAVSSKRSLSINTQTDLITQIYGMLRRHGYKAKRRKHETFTSGKRMLTTKLVNNRKPALPREERQNIRAAVYELEQRIKSGESGTEIRTALNRVTSRVGRLGTLHRTESIALKVRLRKIRILLSH
ncbi:MAG TPA: reverse transcriptase family protein [Gallionella sp.]|nr:reverse transcriptase family protein [Gallionella sp.]